MNGFDLSESSPARNLRLVRFADIDPSPRKTWLIDKMIGEGEFCCVFGAPGSGKSALVGDLAAHVAWGGLWLSRSVTHGSVLYVAAERAAVVKRRMAAWRQYYGVETLPLGILQGSIDLRSGKATADEIVAYARDLHEETNVPVRLVVVDTVSRALAGGDENSPKDMGAFVGSVAAIQEATGAAVIVIHHIPQDGSQRLRGHGALIGAVDVSISVEKGATACSATVIKTNDGEEGEAVSFTMESVEIAENTTAPVVIAADMPTMTEKGGYRLKDKDKAALDVLVDLCLDGKPLPSPGDLPSNIRAVDVENWRDQLYRRGVLDPEHSNPREDFRRLRTKLIRHHKVAQRDDLVWAA